MECAENRVFEIRDSNKSMEALKIHSCYKIENSKTYKDTVM